MTDPVSNAHAAIESELVCPACGAANAPTRTYCHWDPATQIVYCLVCAHDGPLAEFQPRPEGD